MLPKRIMDSSSGSLSKLVIEFESLGKSSHIIPSSDDSALIQKDFTINMIQNKSYGAIDTNSNTNTTLHENQEHEYEHKGQSPIRSVLWNMLNQIIGTGILGIPYIYKSTGIIGSIIVMIIFGIISVYTLNLIIYCGKKMGVYNYETLLEKTFGIKGYIISSFCIAILNIGGMLTNLIIIGDATMKVLSIWGFDSWFDRQIVLIILAAVIILPFCMFRDLSSLEKAGFVKLIAISVIIVVIFLEFFNSINSTHSDVKTGADNNTEITLSLNWASIPSAVGVLAFSFVCHDSSFLLYNTLSNPTKMRFFKLSFYGIFIAITFTLCLSIPAYLTFGNNVDSNILNNYDIYNPLIIAIRVIYIFTMTLTFPGSFFLVRHVFYGWFQKLQCVYSKNYLNNFMPYTVQTAPLSQHLLFTLSIFICIVTISLFVDDLGIIMSSIGSISSVNLAFVFPCLCYMKIMLKSEKLCVYRIMLNLIAPLFITLTGITIAIYGVVSVF